MIDQHCLAFREFDVVAALLLEDADPDLQRPVLCPPLLQLSLVHCLPGYLLLRLLLPLLLQTGLRGVQPVVAMAKQGSLVNNRNSVDPALSAVTALRQR